jgi:hypothetical protein
MDATLPSTNGSQPANASVLGRLKDGLFSIIMRKPKPALPEVDESGKQEGRKTGDPVLDFVLEAGPRAFTPELATKEVRFAIAKTGALGAYKDALQHLAQHQVALIHAAIREVGRQNRIIEKESKATRAFLPYYRKPLLLHDFFEAIYGEGCWKDNDFVEDVLKHHPELRINVKRGIRGQEYAGRN